MSVERYQLVSIDENNDEVVIELNNENKNNRSTLSFIDSGTAYMQSEEDLIKYLIKEKKIINQNVKFAIKYNLNGARYLPIIFNDPEFRFVALNAEDEKKLKEYARFLIDKIDSELCNSNFYSNMSELNIEFFSQISNGNYLDKHVVEKLRRYYEAYGIMREDRYYREMFKKDLVSSLKSYKTIRTLYIFYKIHLNCKSNNKSVLENTEYDIPQMLKYPYQIKQDKDRIEVPEELKKAYDNNGMDGVWAIADSEEIITGGYKFR
jgi:hypothetical protein